MNNKELLEKAKRDYPIGTIHGGSSNTSFTVTSNNMRLNDAGNIYSGNDCGCIYSPKYGWATIISKPFVLPEKYYIHSTTKEETQIVWDWFKNTFWNRFIGNNTTNYYTPNADKNGLFGGSSQSNDGIPIITFEQFKQYVLKENTENMQRNHKKIIGYKFKIDVPDTCKGTIVKLDGGYIASVKFENGGTQHCHIPISSLSNTNWFEPIYEDEKIMIGDYEVKINKNYVIINGIRYERSSLETIRLTLLITSVKSLNVGCNGQYKIDLDLLNKIIDKMNND